jgi:hypothetical protein
LAASLPSFGRHVCRSAFHCATTFAEREEIAICRAYGFGIREIARHLGRSASTISRELRRNAATRRCGTLHYARNDAARNSGRFRPPEPGGCCSTGCSSRPPTPTRNPLSELIGGTGNDWDEFTND